MFDSNSIVYILYSSKLGKYYIGFTTEKIVTRLERHNSNYYDDKFTKSGIPWELYLEIVCECDDQARKIELHIKQMKSKIYIENLKKYPEIILKLKQKYTC